MLRPSLDQVQACLGRDEPCLMVGAAGQWPCVASTRGGSAHAPRKDSGWTLQRLCLDKELLGPVSTVFRVHRNTDARNIVWEGTCSYVTATFEQFAQWRRGVLCGSCDARSTHSDTSKPDDDGATAATGNPFSAFMPAEAFWAYADYKHLAELLRGHDEVLQRVLGATPWEHTFGRPSKKPDGTPLTTLWVNSAGAQTQCHYDTYGDNIVVQVSGCKRWTLYPASSTPLLYPTRVPFEESSVFSAVNVACPNLHIHPKFRSARPVRVTLRPGDALYVPRHYWHFVEGIEDAVALNLWSPRREDVEERVCEAMTRTVFTAAHTMLRRIPSASRDLHFAVNPTEELWAPGDTMDALQSALMSRLTGSAATFVMDNRSGDMPDVGSGEEQRLNAMPAGNRQDVARLVLNRSTLSSSMLAAITAPRVVSVLCDELYQVLSTRIRWAEGVVAEATSTCSDSD